MASRTLRLLYATIIALWILAFLQGALAKITAFDGPLWNGAFQHLNALRRIDAGQTGGVDFQFFHGLLVPYLHYPFYLLLGGDLFASEVARYGINLIAFVVPFFLVFRAALGSTGTALGLTAAALTLSEPLGLHYLAWPSHNTPGVRAAVPFLLLALLFAQMRPKREAIASGLLLGIGFVLGTEHGLAMGVMLVATWVCRRIAGTPRPAADLALSGLAGCATALGLLLAVGGWPGAKGALRYALIDIPEDQFWYFGSPPLPYLDDWGQVFADHRLLAVLGIAATQIVALLCLCRSSASGRRFGPPLIGALAYGAAASIGYLSYTGYHFLLPLIRIELTATLIFATLAAMKLRSHEPRRFTPAMLVLQFGFAITAILAGPSQAYGPSSIVQSPATIRAVLDGVETFASGECQLAPSHQSHLDAVCKAIEENRLREGSPTIWSEYAGLVEARYGIFHPAQDYIIHARGRNGSADYLAAFRAADTEFAFTLHAGYFAHVEKLQASDWGFYEELYMNYELLLRTSIGCLWRRLPGPWRYPSESEWFSVPLASPEVFVIPAVAAAPGGGGGIDPVLVLDVRYEIRPSLAKHLPVIGSSPRYLIYVSGTRTRTPIAVRPYARRIQFPLLLKPGREGACAAVVRSLVGGEWAVKDVRARRVPADVAKKYQQTLKK